MDPQIGLAVREDPVEAQKESVNLQKSLISYVMLGDHPGSLPDLW